MRDWYKRWELKHKQINVQEAHLFWVPKLRLLGLFFFPDFLALAGTLHFPDTTSIDFHGSCECSAVLQVRTLQTVSNYLLNSQRYAAH